MCGRLDQNHSAHEYVAAMHWPRSPALFGSQAPPTGNATPGTLRPLLCNRGGALVVEDGFWGYRAAWARDKMPIAINARLEKLSGRYWAPLLGSGRVIVPAAGWYEWTGEPRKRQAWHIHLATLAPLFIAALRSPGPVREHAAEAGFVIVTADAEGGMVDVQDRRPLVFAAPDAALWLDPELPAQQAQILARQAARGADAFAWHQLCGKLGQDSGGQAPPAQGDLLFE